MQSPPPTPLTILLLGSPQSGKSSLLHGYSPVYSPTPTPQLTSHLHTIGNQAIQFRIWDMPACALKDTHQIQICKQGQVVGLFFDMGHEGRFNGTADLFEEGFQQGLFRYDAKLCLIGSKVDQALQGHHEKLEEAGFVVSGGQTSPEQLTNVFKISVKNQNNALNILCEYFYKVHKDPSLMTITDLQSMKHGYNDCAPNQTNTFSIGTQNSNSKQQKSSQTIVRFILIGNDQVGKTALTVQYAESNFIQQYCATIGVDFRIRNIQHQGSSLKLQIWDTAGLQKFQAITSLYLKGGNRIYMAVFSCTDRQSFMQLAKHVQAIASNTNDQQQNNLKYIICNKTDSPMREVSYQQGSQYAKQVGYGYMEVSAKDHQSTENLFNKTAIEWVCNSSAQPV